MATPTVLLGDYVQDGPREIGSGSYGRVYKAHHQVRASVGGPPAALPSPCNVFLGVAALRPALAALQRTGQTVAIKVVPHVRLVSKKLVESLDAEIRILKRIRHPHIVQLYDVVVPSVRPPVALSSFAHPSPSPSSAHPSPWPLTDCGPVLGT